MIRRALIVGGAIAAVLAGGGYYAYSLLRDPIEFEAPPPVIVEDLPDSIGSPAPSFVEAPILYDLAPAIAKLEAAVPRTFGDINARVPSTSNKRLTFAFAASRAPFQVSIQGLNVRISTVIDYEGRGWYRPPVGPEVSAACGTGGVPRPRIRAELLSRVKLTADWRLATRTSLVRLEPFSAIERDRCKVTVFRVDVTERVVSATRGALEKQLAALDANIARIDTRARFSSWWQKMQVPIRLTDSIYLTLNPHGAQLGKVTSNERTVVANVGLLVQPRVVTGARPNDFALMTPIPELAFGEMPPIGLNVALEGAFTYPVASSLLRKALRGKELSQSGRRISIANVELTGIGGGQVALRVDVRGDTRGRVYFTGTPTIDTVTRQVVVPDLAYDVGSSNLLVRGLQWLKGDDLRDFLRARARIPDSAAVGALVPLAERGMNRQLADGVILRASIKAARGLRARATTTDLRVYAVATGFAHLAISKEIGTPTPDSTRPRPSDPFKLPAKR
ncbi:MAG: DUF4403 family protein [Gemmatimonadaceae bacterium]